MARAKPGEPARIKPKTAAVDESNRGIEQLKDLMAQIEDLSREGFPYRDAVRARTELSLRETIRRIFGEKSEEYQNHKNHKLRTSHRAESAQTIAVLKSLIAQLEHQLLGAPVKAAHSEPLPSNKTVLKAVPASDHVPIATAPGPIATESGPPPQASDGATPNMNPPAEDPSSAPDPVQPAAKKPESTLSSTTAPPLTAPDSAPLPLPSTAAEAISRGTTPAAMEQSARTQGQAEVDSRSSCDPTHPPGSVVPPADHKILAAELVSPSDPASTITASPVFSQTNAVVPPTPANNVASVQPSEISIAAPSPPTIETANAPESPESGMLQLPSASAPPSLQPASVASAGLSGEPDHTLRMPVADQSAVREPRPAPSHPLENPYSATQPTYTYAACRDQQPAGSEIHSSSPSNVPEASSHRPSAHVESLGILRKICSRFHLVVRQLRLRRDDRATLEVEDEYDVQDLLYALLRLEFDEIEMESWCPGYATASRTDYLLNNGQIVIMAKKTRTGLTVRDLTDQIKIDSAHYSGRTERLTLMCFIYDPEGRIGNPRGVESDHAMVSDAYTLEVVIAPK